MQLKGDEMKVKDLKQRQKLRNIETGEVLQVSKKWGGRFIHLIDPTSKKLVYILARHAHDKHEAEREITEWVAAWKNLLKRFLISYQAALLVRLLMKMEWHLPFLAIPMNWEFVAYHLAILNTFLKKAITHTLAMDTTQQTGKTQQ